MLRSCQQKASVLSKYEPIEARLVLPTKQHDQGGATRSTDEAVSIFRLMRTPSSQVTSHSRSASSMSSVPAAVCMMMWPTSLLRKRAVGGLPVTCNSPRRGEWLGWESPGTTSSFGMCSAFAAYCLDAVLGATQQPSPRAGSGPSCGICLGCSGRQGVPRAPTQLGASPHHRLRCSW